MSINVKYKIIHFIHIYTSSSIPTYNLVYTISWSITNIHIDQFSVLLKFFQRKYIIENFNKKVFIRRI